MSMNQYHRTPVLEFHEAFGHPVMSKPTVPVLDARVLRVRLIAEELIELAEACGVKLDITSDYYAPNPANSMGTHKLDVSPAREDKCDLVECADALGDLRYVVDGGNLIFGFPGEAVLAEIHRSNMSKLGADGKPIYREDRKVLKGPDYTPPDIQNTINHVIDAVWQGNPPLTV